jgi:hypothetical protein
MTPAGEAIAAMAAGNVTFADDEIAFGKTFDVIADAIDSTHKFMAYGHRHRDRFLGPAVPVIYMYVRSADGGLEDADEDVVARNFRNGNLLEPQSGLGFCLYDGLHRLLHKRKLDESGNQESRKSQLESRTPKCHALHAFSLIMIQMFNDEREIRAGHPLFMQLRNGLFWHRTSTEDYRRIRADGFIKPNNGRINRWGQRYACQELGGISLFDFTSESEDKVLWEAIKWQQFLGDADPVTVLLGMEPDKLPGKLIRYPDNKTGTTGNVIPWVEVCHCGVIPVSAIVSNLLVCPVDYTRFRKMEKLDEGVLWTLEMEFRELVRMERERQDALFKKDLEGIRVDKLPSDQED